MRTRVALFATCLADTLFPQAAMATVRLLERLGYEVVFPEGQTCCGQMHVNTGYPDDALRLVRRHVRVFAPYDVVVVAPSGSCVGSVRHQHAMVARRAGDERLVGRGRSGRCSSRNSPGLPTTPPCRSRRRSAGPATDGGQCSS